MNAINRGDPDEIAATINTLGAAVAEDSGFGRTAMATSVFSGNLAALKIVREKTATPLDSVGATGNSALMWAAYWGQTDVVNYLLGEGADKSIVNKEGKTAEKLALEGGFQALATIIREYN